MKFDQFPFRAMTRTLSEMRELYPDIPAATIQVFLAIALEPGISGKELLDRVGISQSAVSRHLSILGEHSWRGGEGLGLIEVIEDLEDRRNKIAFLTPKGRTLAISFHRTLSPRGPTPIQADFPSASDHVQAHRTAWRHTRTS